jgi:hypothetical protein
MKIKVEVISLEKEEIVSILSDINSYSNYWCILLNWNDEEYSQKKEKLIESYGDVCFEDVLAEILIDGSSLSFTDEDDVVYTLTLEKLIKGIQKGMTEGIVPVDLDDWDAVSSDSVLQIALFDEVIYG